MDIRLSDQSDCAQAAQWIEQDLFSDPMNIIIMNQWTYGIVVLNDDINQTVELLMLISNLDSAFHFQGQKWWLVENTQFR